MKVFLVYKNDGSSSDVIKVFKDENKAKQYLDEMNNNRVFIKSKYGDKNYSEFYEWDEFEVE